MCELGSEFLVTIYSFFQAPLTSTDTAILSGNLSTQNGNGGGSINLALRRVTSAKGWGEVRVHLLCSVIFNLLPSVLLGGEQGGGL